jgi:hypothetical protein
MGHVGNFPERWTFYWCIPFAKLSPCCPEEEDLCIVLLQVRASSLDVLVLHNSGTVAELFPDV